MKGKASYSILTVMITGFIGVFLFFNPGWAIYVAFSIGIMGSVSEKAAERLAWLWLRLGNYLGIIVNALLLTIIFYLFLFPISLISKFFTQDNLLLKNTGKTTFRDVGRTDIKKNMEKIW